MKTSKTTRLSLTASQASKCVLNGYNAHFTYNGDYDSLDEGVLKENQQFIMDLMRMPVSTIVDIDVVHKSGRGKSGYTTYRFTDGQGLKRSMTVYREGTTTPKNMVELFLSGYSFKWFCCRWNEQFGMTWPNCAKQTNIVSKEKFNSWAMDISGHSDPIATAYDDGVEDDAANERYFMRQEAKRRPLTEDERGFMDL